MRPRHHWFADRLDATRRAVDRGATLVEYAMVVSLVGVVSLGALEFLQESASTEIENQALCVSDRPPPTGVTGDECQFAPTPTDLVVPDPNVVPPTTAAPNPNPDVYAISSAPSSMTQVGGWTVTVPVSVTREVWQDPPAGPLPAAGIEVRARIQMKDPNNPGNNLPDPGFTDCVTNAAGQCDLSYVVPFPDVVEVTMLVIGASSPNEPTSVPPLATFNRPPGW